MKKKLAIGVMLVLSLIGTAACKKAANETKTPANNNLEVTKIEVKRTEIGLTDIHLTGMKLDHLTAKGSDDAFYCNLEENMKLENLDVNASVLVCKDPVYDITYFINYGRDYFIYIYRNGKAELAVEIPARDLFCREGELYFIADTYGLYQFSDFSKGNILKYNPVDGSVSVIVDCSANGMIVYRDGICYKHVEEELQVADHTSTIKTNRYFYSFVNKESSPLPKEIKKLRRWNGYLMEIKDEVVALSESDPLFQYYSSLGYKVAGKAGGVEAIKLVDMQGNEKETLKNDKVFPQAYSIRGTSAYFVEQHKGEAGTEKETNAECKLMKYLMQTGVHEEVAALCYPTDLSFVDMIISNGVVYFGNGLRLVLNSGEQCLMQGEDGKSYHLDCFYTDGTNLFCLSGGKLWLFEEKKSVPITETEFLPGMPLEIGTYVFCLNEPEYQK